MYNFGRTGKEINEKLNQFYVQLSETNKKYADMVNISFQKKNLL